MCQPVVWHTTVAPRGKFWDFGSWGSVQPLVGDFRRGDEDRQHSDGYWWYLANWPCLHLPSHVCDTYGAILWFWCPMLLQICIIDMPIGNSFACDMVHCLSLLIFFARVRDFWFGRFVKGSCQKRLSGFCPLRRGGYPPCPHTDCPIKGGGYPPIPLRKKSAKKRLFLAKKR